MSVSWRKSPRQLSCQGVLANGGPALVSALQHFCVELREGRKRAHLGSRLATVGLALIAGPESGGMAGCGGRQSRSSRAVPRVSGCRADTATAATEAYPIPTMGGPMIHPTSQLLAGPSPTLGNTWNWDEPRLWRQAQTLGFAGRSGSGGLRNRQSRVIAGLVAGIPGCERTPCRRPLAAFPDRTLPP